MLTLSRDIMLPLGWVPGAEFRLENIQGGDHLFYMELFEGLPHLNSAAQHSLGGNCTTSHHSHLHHCRLDFSAILSTAN